MTVTYYPTHTVRVIEQGVLQQIAWPPQMKFRCSYCSAAFQSRAPKLQDLYLYSVSCLSLHLEPIMAATAGLAAAALHSGIPDTHG